MNETTEFQLPAKIEALETRIACVREMQAALAAPAPHFRVPRLVEKPVPDIGAEYQALRLEIVQLHQLVAKAAMKAVRYRVGALCAPGEDIRG